VADAKLVGVAVARFLDEGSRTHLTGCQNLVTERPMDSDASS
jgi:hypothetical protein